MRPIITVVVPVLNEEENLRTTLESLRAQTFKDYELIVVDNGSTDRSLEIARQHADLVLFEERRGAVWAMHRGFLSARGEFLAGADADTIYPPTWLAKMVRALSKPGTVAAYGPMGFRESPTPLKELEAFGYGVLAIFSRLFGVHLTGAANFGFHKEAYIEVGGYEKFGHLASPDFWLSLNLKKIGKVRFVPNMVCYTSNRRFVKLRWKAGFLAFWFWLDVALRRGRLTAEDYWRLVRQV
ncbi:glycosyltransferase family 2 protein [Candidatus Bipolaricaulota bacterium]|nr:glycosyltransferase family 2 protein [Candidatus Bipolaricaulota bacterium]